MDSRQQFQQSTFTQSQRRTPDSALCSIFLKKSPRSLERQWARSKKTNGAHWSVSELRRTVEMKISDH